MGDSQKLSVQLTLDATGLVQGLSVSTKGVDTAAQAIKRSFKDAGEGSEDFTSRLREFKSEATQASRVARFYANDLAEIIPGATGASSAIKGLIAAGLSGGGFATGFEIALVAIKSVNEAMTEQKKLAAEITIAHIEAGSRLDEIYRKLDDSLDGTKTKAMAAATESAKAIRAAGEEARKANVKTLQDAGGFWDTVLAGINGVSYGLGRFGVLSGVASEKIAEMAPHAKTAFEEVTANYAKTDAVNAETDARRSKRQETLAKEDELLAEENADKIREIEASRSDFIVRTRASTQAKVDALKRATPTEGPGAAQAYEREIRMETAIRRDAEVQIAHFREDKAREVNARLIELSDQFATEDIKVQDAAFIKAGNLRVQARRTTDAVLKATLLAEADTEVAFATQTAERIKRSRLQAITDEYVQTITKRQAADLEVLKQFSQVQDQMQAIRDAGGNKQLGEEILRARQAGDARAEALNLAEQKGLRTHAQFLAELKQSEGITANEIGQAWAKAGSHWANGFVRPLETGFASAVKSVAHGTATIGQAIESLGMSIVDSLIDGAIKVGLKSLEEAVLAHAATSVKNVAGVVSYAAVAGAAAASAAAATPIVGPFIAIPTGLAMEAAVMSAFAPQAAAAQGFDIPPGINPITQLHQKEMVLPQNIADPLRDMLASGSQGGGPPIIIQALDSQSFEEYMGRPSTQQKIANLRRTGRWGG